MKRFIREYSPVVIVWFFAWFLLSAFASGEKMQMGNCEKSCPIDYVLYTNMFCEIKND